MNLPLRWKIWEETWRQGRLSDLHWVLPWARCVTFLNGDKENDHHNPIGGFMWAVDLGYIEIYVEVDLISHYLAQPLKGQLDQSLHIFSYLKSYYHSKVVFDSNTVSGKDNQLNRADWM